MAHEGRPRADVQLSRVMGCILRRRGMGHDGYLPLVCLLPMLGPDVGDVTEEDVRRVIRTDTKHRFSLVEDAGTLYVRANLAELRTQRMEKYFREEN